MFKKELKNSDQLRVDLAALKYLSEEKRGLHGREESTDGGDGCHDVGMTRTTDPTMVLTVCQAAF